jgi:hypothetical protein
MAAKDMIEKITIENTERGLFLVQCGGKFAANLTKDEVLGVVASALFSPSGPIFLRDYKEEVSLKYSPAGRAYQQSPKVFLPLPRNLAGELEYQTQRANANWRALCECRGEEVVE